jgi:DNA-directed RNA polymerase specialized sigma subunit
MSKARFPQNWATAEIVKQYMRNHRRYEVKKGRMMPRHQRSAATSSGNISQLPNIDSDENEDMDNENDEDENEDSENNESDLEEDD